jgi:integrase
MSVTWVSSSFKGIRYYEHKIRKHGIKKDRYFALRYQKNSKRTEEGLGWASEGWTAEKAFQKLIELKHNATIGEGPTRLSEKRIIAKDKERHIELENLSFDTFFKKTYQIHSKANKSTNSSRTEEQLYRLWIEPIIGKKPLKKVSPIDLERIKRNMLDAGRAPRTVHYCLAVIRQIFNYAKLNSLFEGDTPVSKVKKPSIDNRRLRFLTKEEALKLLERIKLTSPTLHNMALISLHCGLRAGEIMHLTWGDIDNEKGLLTLRDTKSGRNRVAFMTIAVKETFDVMPSKENNDYVFTDKKGNKIKEVSVSFDRIVKELGFNNGITDPRQKVVFHSLRHTFASWLVENGTDLYVVKELMGHSTIAMTERYSHLGNNARQEAIRKLDASFKSIKENNKTQDIIMEQSQYK